MSRFLFDSMLSCAERDVYTVYMDTSFEKTFLLTDMFGLNTIELYVPSSF